MTLAVIRRRGLLRWVTCAVCLTGWRRAEHLSCVVVEDVGIPLAARVSGSAGARGRPPGALGAQLREGGGVQPVLASDARHGDDACGGGRGGCGRTRDRCGNAASAVNAACGVSVSADRKVMGTFELHPSWSRHSFVIHR